MRAHWIVALLGVGCVQPSILAVDSGDPVVQIGDSGSVTKADPCPIAGEWRLQRAWCAVLVDEPTDMGATGSASVTGDGDSCSIVLAVTVDECSFVEVVELEHLAGDLWEGYSDGGQHPPCRDGALGARALGDVTLERTAHAWGLSFFGSDAAYLQVTACAVLQGIDLVAW